MYACKSCGTFQNVLAKLSFNIYLDCFYHNAFIGHLK